MTHTTGTEQDLNDLRTRRKSKEHASAAGKPVLIVCPRAVLPTWEEHFAEWGYFDSRSILTGGSTTGRNSLQVRIRKRRTCVYIAYVLLERMISYF